MRELKLIVFFLLVSFFSKGQLDYSIDGAFGLSKRGLFINENFSFPIGSLGFIGHKSLKKQNFILSSGVRLYLIQGHVKPDKLQKTSKFSYYYPAIRFSLPITLSHYFSARNNMWCYSVGFFYGYLPDFINGSIINTNPDWVYINNNIGGQLGLGLNFSRSNIYDTIFLVFNQDFNRITKSGVNPLNQTFLIRCSKGF